MKENHRSKNQFRTINNLYLRNLEMQTLEKIIIAEILQNKTQFRLDNTVIPIRSNLYINHEEKTRVHWFNLKECSIQIDKYKKCKQKRISTFEDQIQSNENIGRI